MIHLHDCDVEVVNSIPAKKNYYFDKYDQIYISKSELYEKTKILRGLKAPPKHH